MFHGFREVEIKRSNIKIEGYPLRLLKLWQPDRKKLLFALESFIKYRDYQGAVIAKGPQGYMIFTDKRYWEDPSKCRSESYRANTKPKRRSMFFGG